jgi:hypothetical protein
MYYETAGGQTFQQVSPFVVAMYEVTEEEVEIALVRNQQLLRIAFVACTYEVEGGETFEHISPFVSRMCDVTEQEEHVQINLSLRHNTTPGVSYPDAFQLSHHVIQGLFLGVFILVQRAYYQALRYFSTFFFFQYGNIKGLMQPLIKWCIWVPGRSLR